jgi:DNA-directed RNA polymerase specialized sigma24 family protein
VTGWIGDLRTGGDAAAQHLWERYFDRLVHLAQNKLRAFPRRGLVEDEEDAALSAFDSFCQGVACGRFPELSSRDDLWRLLIVITVRKVHDQVERQGAARRGGGRVAGEADLDWLAGDEPSPEFAALMAEEYSRRRAGLRDDSLRQILDLSLEGKSPEEIAERLDCAVRTVKRKLKVIRDTWRREEVA